MDCCVPWRRGLLYGVVARMAAALLDNTLRCARGMGLRRCDPQLHTSHASRRSSARDRLGWSTANVSFAAAATWRRHATFDANVAAANAVRRRDAAPPAVWRSEPVGDIQDLRADVKYWTNTAVADWLRVPADHFRVTVSEGPSATVPLPWLRGHAQQTRSPVRVRTARPAGCAGQCRSPKQ
jgi:hypothetical protein